VKHVINSRKNVFEGHALNVQQLDVSLPDGRRRNYELVFHRDSVTIIPIEKNGDIWFVEQYRMGSEKKLIELPAGVIDDGESPAECAARETREEIGMAAGKLTHLGAVYLAPGYSSELNHIFLAQELRPDPLQKDDDEFLSVLRLTEVQLADLIAEGKLQDSKSLAALLIFHQKS
jgi:ADP-ribose pyrophosphatase